MKQQFGAAIEQVVRETLAKLGVERALVSVDDKARWSAFTRPSAGGGVTRCRTNGNSMGALRDHVAVCCLSPAQMRDALSTSFVYGADAVMFDLETPALREKDTARL